METTNPIRIKLFWSKVDKEGPYPEIRSEYIENSFTDKNLGRCWVWMGAKDQKGYPNFTVARNKTAKAHRFSFKLAFGWLLEHPYQIDHKCNNPSCVNPRHLFHLLGKDNNAKSNSASAVNKRKTHCKYDHEFSDENTIRKNGRRICITCEKERGRM
jgi:HNH endonuclease